MVQNGKPSKGDVTMAGPNKFREDFRPLTRWHEGEPEPLDRVGFMAPERTNKAIELAFADQAAPYDPEDDFPDDFEH